MAIVTLSELWNFLLVCQQKRLVKFCFPNAEMFSKLQVLTEDMSLFNISLDSEPDSEVEKEEEEEDVVDESFSEQDIVPSKGEEHSPSAHSSSPSPYSSFPSPYSSFSSTDSDPEPRPLTTPTPSDYKDRSAHSSPISPVPRIQFSPETSSAELPEHQDDDETRGEEIGLQNPLSDNHSHHSEHTIDEEEENLAQQEDSEVGDKDELEVVDESEGDETASLRLEEQHSCIVSSPPPSASAAIMLSSEDEDTNLENMFADLRLKSTKKQAAAQRVVSRKSLDVFIVSDSEELSEEEDDDDEGKENQSPLPPYMFKEPPSYNGRCCSPVKYTPPACSTPAYLYTPKRIPSLATVSTVHTPSASKSVRYHRHKMADELYQLFNSTVFDDKLPKDLELIWNKRLRTTAGYCSYSGSLNNRTVRIELSTKVCDTYERIRDTVIHEMCHAANWLIDGTRRAGHGRLWKAWATKANTVHPDINTIDRCHSYEISYKYSYICTVCDFKIGRHSKSINLETARCPYCGNCLKLGC